MTRCLLSRTPPFLPLLAAVLVASRPHPPLDAGEVPTRCPSADREKEGAELPRKIAELKAASGKPRPIGMRDIPGWRSARGGELSNDGQWFACRISPAEGDGEVIIRQTRGDKEYRLPVRGLRGDGGANGLDGPGLSGRVAFSHDSRWCAFMASPSAPPTEPGSRSATPRRSAPKVVLVNLATGMKAEVEGVRRFAFNGEAATWIALERMPARPRTPGGPPSPGAAADEVEGAAGGDLMLRELAGGAERTLRDVGDWAFDRTGRWLALTIGARDRAGNGVDLCDMTTAARALLDRGGAGYTALAWADKSNALTVLKGVDDPEHGDRATVCWRSRTSLPPGRSKSSTTPAAMRHSPRT